MRGDSRWRSNPVSASRNTCRWSLRTSANVRRGAPSSPTRAENEAPSPCAMRFAIPMVGLLPPRSTWESIARLTPDSFESCSSVKSPCSRRDLTRSPNARPTGSCRATFCAAGLAIPDHHSALTAHRIPYHAHGPTPLIRPYAKYRRQACDLGLDAFAAKVETREVRPNQAGCDFLETFIFQSIPISSMIEKRSSLREGKEMP
jgi:hypothetical protein